MKLTRSNALPTVHKPNLRGKKKTLRPYQLHGRNRKKAKLSGRVLDQLSPLERTHSNLLPAEIPDGWAACS